MNGDEYRRQIHAANYKRLKQHNRIMRTMDLLRSKYPDRQITSFDAVQYLAEITENNRSGY